MTLAIVGSVNINVEEAVRIIDDVLDRHQPTLLVSGGADGVDSLAASAARRRGIRVQEFIPRIRQWDPPRDYGFKARNRDIAKECDVLVRIVAKDTGTYGSGWTRDTARSLGKPTEEFVV